MRFVTAIRLLAIMGILLAGVALPGTASAQVAVEFSVGFAPPALPVYEQPICPGEGYIWTPGYWAWDDDDGDYYWVPGTWVVAPRVGYLWTPGYWGWGGEAYVFHVGYWGPVVGFYGGIDYGWGYTGRGYYGGRWDHDRGENVAAQGRRHGAGVVVGRLRGGADDQDINRAAEGRPQLRRVAGPARWLVAVSALLGRHDDGADGVLLGAGDDDRIGLGVGGRCRVRRRIHGKRIAVEA